jgi:hypothetical protein
LKSTRRSHTLKGSQSMGDGRILLKPRRGDSFKKSYRMSVISARSISLDSAFKIKTKLIQASSKDFLKVCSIFVSLLSLRVI